MHFDRVLGAVSGVFAAVSVIVALTTPTPGIRNAAITAAVIFALVCLGVIGWEISAPMRRNRTGSQTRTEEVSTDPQRALVMTFQEEHVDVFQHDAWILQVKVSVRNRDRVQHRLTGPWELTNVRGVGVITGLSNEADRISRDRPLPSSLIEAGKTVEGWYVGKIAYTPVDGIPNYRLTVQAETGYDYGFRRIGSPTLETGTTRTERTLRRDR